MMREYVPLTSDRPFSSAVRDGDLIAISGQLGRDEDGGLVPGGVGPETDAALQAMAQHLERLGAALPDVIKTTVFLVDMADYAAYNAVYRRHFPSDFPARSTVVVKELGQGARIEIEALAVARR